jgi:hypothetical protein
MGRVQLYPLREPIYHIQRHDQIPPTAQLLGKCVDTSTGRDKLYTLVKQNKFLSVLVSYRAGPHDQYYCSQYDFPLRVLAWFPWALGEFRKSPFVGGLHAGAMTSADMEVDGEMLCVQNTCDGYALVNRSRNQQDPISDYDPVDISLSWDFLYKKGFLELWESLGEAYLRGEFS